MLQKKIYGRNSFDDERMEDLSTEILCLSKKKLTNSWMVTGINKLFMFFMKIKAGVLYWNSKDLRLQFLFSRNLKNKRVNLKLRQFKFIQVSKYL